MDKYYRAYSKDGSGMTAGSPKAAADKFFGAFPNKRKCNIIEGTIQGELFVVTYGRASDGEWPASFKDVTKTSAANLPGKGA